MRFMALLFLASLAGALVCAHEYGPSPGAGIPFIRTSCHIPQASAAKKTNVEAPGLAKKKQVHQGSIDPALWVSLFVSRVLNPMHKTAGSRGSLPEASLPSTDKGNRYTQTPKCVGRGQRSVHACAYTQGFWGSKICCVYPSTNLPIREQLVPSAKPLYPRGPHGDFTLNHSFQTLPSQRSQAPESSLIHTHPLIYVSRG
uniref:Secreted protein n=1 Tax=Equus asinus asinus TaxID=83772 RepID=A0A8C4LP18_EQUAS